MNEYIIIDKDALLKRIEELEDLRKYSSSDNNDYYKGQIMALNNILSQSTPLIPEIERAIEYGLSSFEDFDADSNYDAASRIQGLKEIQQDYISNLKLDLC